MEITLTQSGFSSSWKITLSDAALVYTHAEALSSKKTIPYRQITGLFRDAERFYVVWGREVVHFLHQPQKEEYTGFSAQLLRRVKTAHGA